MSLVNDMLRDLDQRRKESDGPAARIKLTPASDYRKRDKRNPVPAIAVGLIAVAGVLAYTWINMNDSGATRQLATPVTPIAVAPGIVEDNNEVDAIPVSSPQPVEVVSAAPSGTPAIPVTESLDELLARSSENQVAAPAVAVTTNIATTTNNDVQNVAAVNSTPATRISNDISAPAAPVTSVSNNTVVRSQGATTPPVEQVKGLTEPSPEVKDTMVVQESLRLIANNQTTAAFAKLEQYLIENPYAHQTRETYAKFLMNQGDSASADALVSSGLELAPNHSGFKKVKARLLIGGGDIQSAVNILESRAPTVLADGEYHEILASAQLAVRDYEGAALSYTGLIQLDQTQGRWWYGYAAAQDALGNTTAAQQAYTRAMEKPNLSSSLRRRSQDRLTALGR